MNRLLCKEDTIIITGNNVEFEGQLYRLDDIIDINIKNLINWPLLLKDSPYLFLAIIVILLIFILIKSPIVLFVGFGIILSALITGKTNFKRPTIPFIRYTIITSIILNILSILILIILKHPLALLSCLLFLITGGLLNNIERDYIFIGLEINTTYDKITVLSQDEKFIKHLYNDLNKARNKKI